MDAILRKVLKDSGPKFNKDVGNGLSRLYVETLPEYLSEVFKSAMGTLSPDIKLVYKGYRKITPTEDFYNDINNSSTKNTIDISRSNLYKVEYGFEYDNVAINRIIALPYVDRGGYLQLSDAHYALTTVLSEYPISPAPGEIFIRILRDKLNIKKMYRNIIVNDEKRSIHVIHSRSYKLISNVNNVIPIALYSFLKYGLVGTFEKQFNVTPLVMRYTDEVKKKYSEAYDIYRTTGIKPRTITIINYIPHDICILIKKKDIINSDKPHLIETYIASVIYSIDLSPLYGNSLYKVLKGTREPTTDFDFNTIDDESLFWITLLGKVIFKNKFTMDRIQTDVLEHIKILNGYLDIITRQKLEDIGVYVDDFFDLLIWSITNFDELVIQHESYSSKLENRYIEFQYFVLYNLIVSINKAFLEIKRSGAKRELVHTDVFRIFNQFLKSKKIYSLTKSNGMNIAIRPVDSTSDNLYFKLSSLFADQNAAQGVVVSKNNTFPIATRSINAEDIFFGNMLMLQKKRPSPRFTLSPFVEIDLVTSKFTFTALEKESISKISSLISDIVDNYDDDIVDDIDEITMKDINKTF